MRWSGVPRLKLMIGALIVSLFLATTGGITEAHPDNVSGGASGVMFATGSSRAGPAPQVVLPARGGAASAEEPSLVVPNMISTGPLSVFTSGGYGSSDTTAQSVASVESISVLGGRITADLVVAMASSSGNGVTAESGFAGSQVINLIIDGVPKGDISGANVGFPIAGGTVVVNEQKVEGDGSGTSSIAVTALRVILRSSSTWGITDDIRVGNAWSGVATSPFAHAWPLEECVFYTGGGRIDRVPMQSRQDFATFGFNATMRNSGQNCKGPAGQLQFVDHYARVKFHGTSADITQEFDDPDFGGKCAMFQGAGRYNINNTGWNSSNYQALACDNGEPGVGRDKFRIFIEAIGYDSLVTAGKGPILRGGNIQRHAP